MFTSILSGLSILGGVASSAFGYFSKKADIGLEKYKVDGLVDQKLVEADVQIIQAQKELLLAQNQYGGYRYLHYLFGYPLALYFTACLVDAVTEKIPGWENTWDVLAMNQTLSQWSGWIIGGLFLHASIPSKWR